MKKSKKSNDKKSQQVKRGNFWRLKDFVQRHLLSPWKLGDLVAETLGSFNPRNETKFMKDYVSRLRYWLLGDPMQLLLPIKKNGLIEGYKVATPADSDQTEKVLEAYVRRAQNAVARTHRTLEVIQGQGLMPVEQIELIRQNLPKPLQMKMNYP